jgi:N-acetylmuramoyl-L-alanine amidase
MVPLKFFSDYLGVEVEWYGNTRIVNLVIEDEEVVKRAQEVSRSYNRKSVYAGYTVVLDPGHGGSDNGAYYGGIAEKTINLNIAKKVKGILEKYDIKVYMTRTSDVTTSLASRTSLANSVNSDLYISIHSNAIANSRIKGTEILYKQNSLVQDGVSNKILAQSLSNSVSEYAGTYKRGLINRTNLYVLNRTTMPAALVEVGYMTNSSELKNLKSETFRSKVAEGIADGILDTLMIMIKN